MYNPSPAPAPDDRVQVGLNYSETSFADSYNTWVAVGNRGDIFFGGGLSPGLGAHLGNGPQTAQSASENILATGTATGVGGGGPGGAAGGGMMSAQGSFAQNSLQLHVGNRRPHQGYRQFAGFQFIKRRQRDEKFTQRFRACSSIPRILLLPDDALDADRFRRRGPNGRFARAGFGLGKGLGPRRGRFRRARFRGRRVWRCRLRSGSIWLRRFGTSSRIRRRRLSLRAILRRDSRRLFAPSVTTPAPGASTATPSAVARGSSRTSLSKIILAALTAVRRGLVQFDRHREGESRSHRTLADRQTCDHCRRRGSRFARYLGRRRKSVWCTSIRMAVTSANISSPLRKARHCT